MYILEYKDQEHEKNRLGEELDNLDVLSDDYDSDYERIQDEMDDIYDRIELLELSLKKLKKKYKEAQKGIRSVDGIRTILQNFSKFFGKMSCEEQRELYRRFIERIEVFPEEQEDGRILKSIWFRFPVRYGESNTIETWIQAEGKPDEEIAFVLDCSEVQVTVAEAKATYAEIRAYVLEHTGMKVSSLYIAQIKRKYGIDIGIAYNKPEKNKNRVPICPKEKKRFMRDFIEEIELYPERQGDGHILKQLSLGFPVFYEGSEGDTIRLLKQNTVESCVLLERVSNRKTDAKVRIDVVLEDYYRIKAGQKNRIEE